MLQLAGELQVIDGIVGVFTSYSGGLLSPEKMCSLKRKFEDQIRETYLVDETSWVEVHKQYQLGEISLYGIKAKVIEPIDDPKTPITVSVIVKREDGKGPHYGCHRVVSIDGLKDNIANAAHDAALDILKEIRYCGGVYKFFNEKLKDVGPWKS